MSGMRAFAFLPVFPEPKIMFFGVDKTGFKKILLQKTCFIPTQVVSDCPKNSRNPQFYPQRPQVN